MSSASLASLSASLSAEGLAWTQRKPLEARKRNVDLAVLGSMHIKKWDAKRETEHRWTSLFALSVMFLSGLGNLTALPHGLATRLPQLLTRFAQFAAHISRDVGARESMALALFSILMIIAGLVIRDRGAAIVRTNPRSLDAIRSGLRARAFGTLIAIIAIPWLVIGLMTSKII